MNMKKHPLITISALCAAFALAGCFGKNNSGSIGKSGADAKAMDKNGKTALMYARENNSEETAEALTEIIANMYAR